MKILNLTLMVVLLFMIQDVRSQNRTNPLCKIDTISFKFSGSTGEYKTDSLEGYVIRLAFAPGNKYMYVYKNSGDSEYTRLKYKTGGDTLISFYNEKGKWIRSETYERYDYSGFNVWRMHQMLSQCQLPKQYLSVSYNDSAATYINWKDKWDSIYFNHKLNLATHSISRELHTGEMILNLYNFFQDNDEIKQPAIVDSILSGIPYDQFSVAYDHTKYKMVTHETDFKNLVFYSFDSLKKETYFSELVDTGKVVILDFWYIGCKHCHKFQNTLVTYLEKNNICDSVTIIRINAFDQHIERINAFIESRADKYSCGKYMDLWYGWQTLADAGYTTGYPLIVVISKKGEVEIVQVGNNKRNLPKILQLTQQ